MFLSTIVMPDQSPSRLASKITVAFGCAFLLADCLFACSPKSSATVPLASIEGQLASGARIYTQTCATSTCHGTHGEGIRSGSSFSVWPLVGADFQTRHPNAEIAFDVIRSGGEANLRALSDQQIYDSIAYELGQNRIPLTAPLTASNAYATFGGLMSGSTANGLYPPLGDFQLAISSSHAPLPLSAAAGGLRLQVDQFAQASAIGGIKPSAAGVFLMLVFVLADTGPATIAVGPENLALTTPSGSILNPVPVDPHTAIEKFHDQTIQPQYGTAALAIFSLPAPDQFDQLIYADGPGNRLALSLKP